MTMGTRGWKEINFDSCIELDSTPSEIKIKSSDYHHKGKYPIIDQGKELIAGYSDNPTKLFPTKDEVVIFGDHTRIVKFVNFPFCIGADGTKVLRVKKDLLIPKFFYYQLQWIPIQNAGYTRHYKFLKRKRILVPPKEYQQYTVQVLEKADSIKNKRKILDEEMRNFLYAVFLQMFGDPVNNEKNWKKKEIRDFGKVITGNTPPRSQPKYYGNYINWVKSDNITSEEVFVSESKEMLSEEGSKVGRIAPKRSVLVTCIAGSVSCIGNAGLTSKDVAFNQQINAIVPNENTNEFFLYCLINLSKKYIQSRSNKALKGIISKTVFESISLISPPFDLQRDFGLIAIEILRLRATQKAAQLEIDHLFDSLMDRAFKGELVR